MKNLVLSLSVISLILFFVSDGYVQTSPLVRVMILEGQKSVEIGATGSYEVKGEIQTHLFKLPQKAKPTPEGISIDQELFGRKIWINPKEKNSLIMVNRRRYRGEILVQQNGLFLEVINQLPVEEYLYGVIKWEISPTWLLSVLKAQAIVARTYALKKVKDASAKNQKFYLTNTVDDQVYEGVEAEDPRTTEAVNLTRGEVLTYQGELINAYYHCCCGGYTADPRDVWGGGFPYLKAKPDEFCKGSPYYRWELKIKVEEVAKILRENGYSVGKIYRIRPGSRDEGGRVREICVEYRGGKRYIKGTELRRLIGPDRLKSTLFTVKRWADYFIFTGRGWGHGVGMCQWGAKEMAERGYNTREILQFYYPGTRIEKIY